MTNAGWSELWRLFVRAKGERCQFPLRRGRQYTHCSVCERSEEIDGQSDRIIVTEHSYAKLSLERTDPHQFARFVWRHNVGCARASVVALAPIARIIASWSEADRKLETDLLAVGALDETSRKVLEDFYLERDFLVQAKRALRAAKVKYGIVGWKPPIEGARVEVRINDVPIEGVTSVTWTPTRAGSR